jgi:hypothetical protein
MTKTTFGRFAAWAERAKLKTTTIERRKFFMNSERPKQTAKRSVRQPQLSKVNAEIWLL